MNQTNKIKVAFSAQVQIKLDQREEEKKKKSQLFWKSNGFKYLSNKKKEK